MSESINYGAVLLATVVQLIVGGIWYTPVFGKVWGKIHGFDALSKKTQAEMQKEMVPLLVAQFLVTGVTALFLAQFMLLLSEIRPYELATWLWLGFMVPVQISAVLFGGTEKQWISKKILIMAGGSFVCIQLAAVIINWLQ